MTKRMDDDDADDAKAVDDRSKLKATVLPAKRVKKNIIAFQLSIHASR